MNTSTIGKRASAFTSRTTTQFASSNVNNSVASGIGLVIDPVFRDLMTELLLYLNYYSVGDFQSIMTNLTSDRYIELSSSLGRLIITDPTSLLLRSIAMSALQGLQRAYMQYTQLVNTTNLYTIVEKRAAILDNMDQLKAFILKINTTANSSIFGDHTITSSVPALIPAAYLQYIQTYGYPQDGVFNVNLLASMG